MDMDDKLREENNIQEDAPVNEPSAAEQEAPKSEKDSEKDNKKDKKKEKEKMTLYDWVQCVVGALVVGILLFMFVGRIIGVSGSSMYPTLHDTDKIVISDLFYSPKAGDIVVVQTDTFGPHPIVKRIIATEGQTVDIDFTNGIVYVDGEALDEPYINELTHDRENFSGEVTVPEGCIFVMGDNRNASTDSRTNKVGMVDERCILGKVYIVLIPGNTAEDPIDISRFGSVY